jgi:hypothetical protein
MQMHIDYGADFLTEEVPTVKIPKETMSELRRRSGLLSDLPPLYPADYEPCAICGFDHEYEPELAATVSHPHR